MRGNADLDIFGLNTKASAVNVWWDIRYAYTVRVGYVGFTACMYVKLFLYNLIIKLAIKFYSYKTNCFHSLEKKVI